MRLNRGGGHSSHVRSRLCVYGKVGIANAPRFHDVILHRCSRDVAGALGVLGVDPNPTFR